MTEPAEPIAIIGMSARLPGARDLDQFWRNLAHGRESVSFLAEEELHGFGVSKNELASPDYVRAAALLPDLEGFDADLFGMTRREAESCDPQIRTFLEVTHAALENAGYDPYQLGGACGVFGTTGPIAYYHRHLAGRRDLGSDGAGLSLMASNNLDYAATLTSYKLNLTGPSFTVLSACSSSLVALHLACQSLRLGECDVAVAGGAMVMIPYGHGYRWQPGSVLSRDGHCRAFDARATGTIFGSGAASVVVKRLSDALAAGDNVRAVIPAIALNNDGGPKSSFSAPSVTGQAAVIMEAMALAGSTPRDISYVELHATGTQLGDPVEVAALKRAYRLLAEEPLEPASCPIGSVKSNIGHLGAVAGLASLIKVVLALEQELLAPSINVDAPNPKLELEHTPFSIETTARPWPRTAGRPRRAGVSSLGIGGTNAHLLVEEAPAVMPVRPDGRPRVIVWSARSRAAEREQRLTLGQFFATLDDERFADAAATLQQGRTPHPYRATVVAADAAECARLLSAPPPDGTGPAGEPDRPGGVGFALPSSREWNPSAAATLYGRLPVFTIEVDELAEVFAGAGLPVLDDWRDGRATDGGNLLAQVALARTWERWGIAPEAVVGSHDGDLAAAVITGQMPIEAAVARLAGGLAAPDRTDRQPDGSPTGTVLVLGTNSPMAERFGARAVPALGPPGADPFRSLLAAVGLLWGRGHRIRWEEVDPDRPVRRVAVPGYPYQRERAWVDPPPPDAAVSAGAPAGSSEVGGAESPAPATSSVRTLVWESSDRLANEPVSTPDRTALVILPPGGQTAAPVLEAVAGSGFRPIPMEWPVESGVAAPPILDSLLRAGGAPDLLVHAVCAVPLGSGDSLDQELGRSFWSLFNLARRAGRVLERMPELVVVSTSAVDVSGSEPFTRARSTLQGLVATLRQELSGARARLIDVGARTPAAELAAELTATDHHDLVALRGLRRWVRRQRSVAVQPGPSGLRAGGRYLITGGLGGLGLALARALAKTGRRPRLVLLQRRSAADADSEALRALTELGAEVEVVAGDVANVANLRAVVGELVSSGGPFHGIFHLAGQPGGGLVQFREPADALAVLRPKVHGTVALEDAFADHPELDFVVHFSSLAAIHGLVGSADYAAANAFQDASAWCHTFRARRVQTVSWPAWSGVGMAARSVVDVNALARGRAVRASRDPGSTPAVTWSRRCSAAEDWFLDEHRLDGRPLAPGTSVLALILQAARAESLATSPLTVDDLTFLAPILVRHACEVQVRFHTGSPGWEVEVWYRDLGASGEGGEWVRCARARIAAAPDEGSPTRTMDPSEIREIPPSVANPVVRSRAGRLRLGPRWNLIEAIWLLSPRRRVARLRLPEPFLTDLAAYPVHPGLLDMATGILCHHRPELFLPFAYQRIVVHDRLSAEVLSTVRVTRDEERVLTADIDVCDPSGRLLIEIEGFTMLVADRLDPADVGNGDGEAPGSAGDTEPERLPDPPPPARTPDSGVDPGLDAGLDPDRGARMMLALLDSPVPAHVLVTTTHAEPVALAVDPDAEPVRSEESSRHDPAPRAQAADGDVAARVRAIWASAFGVPEVGADADFFGLGGDSLSLIDVLAQVREEFGVDLPAAVIFDAPTVAEFAATIERERAR